MLAFLPAHLLRMYLHAVVSKPSSGGNAVLQSQWNFCFSLSYVKQGKISMVQDSNTQLWGSGCVGILQQILTQPAEVHRCKHREIAPLRGPSNWVSGVRQCPAVLPRGQLKYRRKMALCCLE